MISKGFTLIELMIVVAIIGILSMFALPAFQDYTKKTHVSEGLTLADTVKKAALLYNTEEGVWPANNNAAGLADIVGNAVNSVVIDDSGNIVIHYNAKVDSAVLTLNLMDSGTATETGTYTWECASFTPGDKKWLPKTCAGQF